MLEPLAAILGLNMQKHTINAILSANTFYDIDRGNRFEARKPNEAETKEFEKAKKKRRFL